MRLKFNPVHKLSLNQDAKRLEFVPGRLISLWDMIQLFLGDICRRILDIEEVAEKFKRAALDPEDTILGTKDFQELERIMHSFMLISRWLAMPTTDYQNDALRIAIQSGSNTVKGISPMLQTVYSRMKFDMNQIVAVRIPDDGVKHYEQEHLFGALVFRSFAAAKDDIKSAGTCLAIGQNTASVFHSMRVVEHGMRAVAGELWVNIKNKTIESADWGQLIKAIKLKIDARQQKLSKSKRKKKGEHEALNLLTSLTDDMNVFRSYWRNNTMHTRASYNPQEAAGVLERVKFFMEKLANNAITEPATPQLSKHGQKFQKP